MIYIKVSRHSRALEFTYKVRRRLVLLRVNDSPFFYLLQNQSLIKSSRAISCVSWLWITDVSGTISVPIIIIIIIIIIRDDTVLSPRRLWWEMLWNLYPRRENQSCYLIVRPCRPPMSATACLHFSCRVLVLVKMTHATWQVKLKLVLWW